MICRPRRRRGDQRYIERSRDPTSDLVLYGKEVAQFTVEPLGPEMRVGLGIDELRVDPYLVARPLDAPFQQIAHAQFAADILCVDWLVLIGEGAVARDHKHVREPRQVGRQIIGDAVGKILLPGIVAAIGERQHRDRPARGDERPCVGGGGSHCRR